MTNESEIRLLREIFPETYDPDGRHRKAEADFWKARSLACLNRLTKLVELDAPSVIICKEISMLQERFIEWSTYAYEGDDTMRLICAIANCKDEGEA
jgi:hypothetical protein